MSNKKWKELAPERKVYCIETNPTDANYEKMYQLMSEADAAVVKQMYPNLVVRLATEEESKYAGAYTG